MTELAVEESIHTPNQEGRPELPGGWRFLLEALQDPGAVLATTGGPTAPSELEREVVEGPKGSLDLRTSWTGLSGVLREHGLWTMFCHRARHSPAFESCAEEARRAIEAEISRAKSAAGKVLLELEKVLDELGAASLKPVVLKGPHLALRYYEHFHLRPMIDLDFLLPSPTEARRAFDILLRRGYVLPEGTPTRDLWGRNRHLPALTSPATGLPIELHGALLHSPFDRRQRELAALTGTLGELDHAGLRFAVMTPECLVVYLLAHAIEQHAPEPPRLITLWDVRSVLEAEAEKFDWQRLGQVSKSARLGDPVGLGLAWLRLAFPGLVPDEIPGIARSAQRWDVISGDNRRSARALLQIWHADSAASRRKALRSMLFPEPAALGGEYDRWKGKPYGILLLVRWWDLACRLARLGWGWVRAGFRKSEGRSARSCGESGGAEA